MGGRDGLGSKWRGSEEPPCPQVSGPTGTGTPHLQRRLYAAGGRFPAPGAMPSFSSTPSTPAGLHQTTGVPPPTQGVRQAQDYLDPTGSILPPKPNGARSPPPTAAWRGAARPDTAHGGIGGPGGRPLTLSASSPMRRVLRSWSLRMRKGRPYSSNARVPMADIAAPLARPGQAGAGYRRTRRAVTQHAHPRAAPRLRSRQPCDTFGGWDLCGASSGPFWKHPARWELRGAPGPVPHLRGVAVREGYCIR